MLLASIAPTPHRGMGAAGGGDRLVDQVAGLAALLGNGVHGPLEDVSLSIHSPTRASEQDFGTIAGLAWNPLRSSSRSSERSPRWVAAFAHPSWKADANA